MQPLLRRLQQYEERAIKENLIDPVIIQPKVIRGWPDLMERAEHLYYMLGGNSRILSDRATKVQLTTFLQTDTTTWEGEVERFLNDNSFIGLTGTKTSNWKSEEPRREAETDEARRDINPHASAFLMLRAAKTEEANATGGIADPQAKNQTRAVPTTYSKAEDARSIRDTDKLEAAIGEKPMQDAQLEGVLVKANLRSIDSLVDEEARQDETAVESISRDILSNQGVMQPEISADPSQDEVLRGLMQTANASSPSGKSDDG